jgi:hypothetical protein
MENSHSQRGRWSDLLFPHIGWTCVEAIDLGDMLIVCEMCESSWIRFAHRMEHANHPGALVVGAVCAGNMEQDSSAPLKRERRLAAMERRRKNFASRKWRVSNDGNPYLNVDGFRLLALPQLSGCWALLIVHRYSGREAVRGPFSTLESAKRDAVDALEWAQDHLNPFEPY